MSQVKWPEKVQQDFAARLPFLPARPLLPNFTYSALPYNDSIRLLRILRGHGKEPPRCKIFTSCLRDAESSPYKALSYAWGDPEPRHFVNLNNKSHRIPTNAFEALQNLREEDSDIVIWVDAICINQRDRLEKAQQVAMMGRIYSSAVVVIAWVGPFSDGVDKLFSYVTRIVREAVRLVQTGAFGSYQELCTDLASGMARQEAETFAVLLTQPWFSRLWIVQEMALAREARLRSGRYSIDFQVLRIALGICGGRVRDLIAGNIEGVNRATSLFYALRTFETRNYAVAELSLADTAYVLGYAMVSDSRDRVYGLLGILEYLDLRASKSFEPLQVSYESPHPRVFVEATKWSIKRDKDLRILSLAYGLGSDHSSSNWVPNFGATYHAVFGIQIGAARQNWYNADGGQHISHGHDWWLELEETTLVIMGEIHSSIHNAVGGETCLYEKDSPWLKQCSDLYRALESRGIDAAKRWTILTAGFWWASRSDNTFLSHIEAFTRLCLRAEDSVDSLVYAELCKYISESPSGDNAEKNMASEMLESMNRAGGNRWLAITLDGSFAYVPEEARIGDEVCILRGGRVPYIIRPVPGRDPKTWKFIGECWVDGLMHHEPDELKLNQQIRLI